MDVRKMIVLGMLGGGFSSPKSFPNLTLWLDASQITGLNNNDVIATWADMSGNGNNAVQAGETLKPKYITNVLNGKPVVRFDGSNDTMATATSFLTAAYNTAFTWYAVTTGLPTVVVGLHLIGSHSGNKWHVGSYAANVRQISMSGLTPNIAYKTYPYNVAYPVFTKHVIEGFSYNGSQSIAMMNGIPDVVARTGNLGLSGDLTVGNLSSGGYPYKGDMAEIIIYNAAHTTAQMQTVQRYLATKWGYNIRNKIWTFIGDSRTAGTGGTGLGYIGALNTLYGSPTNIEFYNMGINAQTVATMITNQTHTNAYTDGAYYSGALQNVCVVWGGVNDYAGGADAATIYGRLSTLCAAKKALGFKTIVCTEIDAQASVDYNDWHSTVYAAVNALIAADSSFADGVADLGADVRLQNALDTTYFAADKIHLNDTGYAVVAGIVKTAIDALP